MESVHEPAVAARKRPQGLFVGLCTLDVIQLVDHVPGVNEKLTAREQVVAAGGPAANAAVAFAHLGGSATLLTAIGCHPLGIVVAADLDRLGVNVVDLAAGSVEPPAVSSVLVTASSGDRAVSSTNATAHRLAPPDGLDALVAACDVVEFDGHHLELATAAARAARAAGRRTVLDGGSWKAGTERLLPWIDVAVCSDDFRPPGAGTRTAAPTDTLRFLRDNGVGWSAVSRGGQPILWAGPHAGGAVDVPAVQVADTLGAGDVLHGALAHRLAVQDDVTSPGFADALREAAAVASRACASFGTRAWMRGE
ncbi:MULTISPECIES: PfkB family carbohydrate kinase [Streptomyces]|uniref:PfkB family carbohydrate kinase n=1 Tax=Streptomyces TaxID=1883 RepID=UPI000A385EDA|nr:MULTISPECIES: PfkB family carbohydrate kinase [Streptomyces]MDX3581003.1 PfkB family carbohydrate kinase [Streptomyces europaeiscabiei]MDX3614765.1 PfkB family carbohydrate kinase [Streptomyces europaeiscabiei]MDX3631113.1 PfkB family carbohydrate kinase [Streptomyces europaeiscabiei]MDX3648873.1 PfkB family carbohydrate kinase [Streptomyces europaeiscabiei]WUD37585.1 PfkB family carbohydrate kinase [Streptomyces europaeiscabiei]